MRITGYEMRAARMPLVMASHEAALGEGQVVVEVAGCGVCHTDLGFLDEGVPTRHPLPLILGHEISGRVVEEGRGVSGWAGRAVVVPAVMPCGRCELCGRGRGSICPDQLFPGCDAHGGFASHVVVPAAGLCPVHEDSDGPELAELAVVADAVSTAYQAIVRSGLGEGDVAIFVGIGGVGGFGVQIAAALGAWVLAIDVDAERLARQMLFGASAALDASDHADVKALRKAVRQLVKEAGGPSREWRIFETSGTPAGQQTAFALLNHGGYLGVVGYHPGDVSVRLSNLMALDARAEGNWGCLPERFPEVLELVRTGQVQLSPFVTFEPMSRVNDVLDAMRSGHMKQRPILVPDFN